MTPIRTIHGRAVILDRANVDTDQIIPARFLTTTSRTGLGKRLFADWRFDQNGDPRPDFALNAPVQGAPILVAGENFGCGSSREHAVWALQDFGFKAVIAPSIADIFRNNALKNGLLPVVAPAPIVDQICRAPGELTISLEDQELRIDDGTRVSFSIDAFARHCLLAGVDELQFLLDHATEIERFEKARK